jgi:protein-L-isoaspartate(D-aspartate) O-methyltransferase
MIKQQLRTGGVSNDVIIELFNSIPRHAFVPTGFQAFAYSDMQIPMPHGQRMMTPLEEALLVSSLDLKGHERVLEVGTGSGFLTALLSHLSQQVISVDYYAEFTNMARQQLKLHGCDNAQLYTGNAEQGWLDCAPYDVIVFTGGLSALNQTQRLQVLPGGKLFAIIGQAPVMQGQLHSLDHDGLWHQRLVFETVLPPMINSLQVQPFVF